MCFRTTKRTSGRTRTIIAATVLSAILLFSSSAKEACSAPSPLSPENYFSNSYAAYCYPLRDGEEIRSRSGKGLILRSISEKNGFFYIVFGATTDFDGKLVVDRDATVVYDNNGGRFEATSVRIGNRTTTERTIVTGTETPVEIEFQGRPDFSGMWPRVDLGIDGETLVVRNFRAYVFAGKSDSKDKKSR